MEAAHVHVAKANMDHLGWGSAQQNATGEVAVLCDDREVLHLGEFPDLLIVARWVDVVLVDLVRSVPLAEPAWQVRVDEVKRHTKLQYPSPRSCCP